MKRIIPLVLALSLLLGLCAASPVAGAAEEKVDVLLWNHNFEDWNIAWCEEKVAEFNSGNYGVNVIQEIIPGDVWEEKMKSAQAANAAPDMYLTNYGNIPFAAKQQLIMPMGKYLPEDAWADLYDNVKALVTVDGEYYAYPQLLEPAVVMYYRTDLFEAAGLDPNAPPKTWDELLAAAKAITTPDVFGLGLNYEWSMWGWEFTAGGHWPIADDWASANCQDQGYIDLLTFFKDAYASGSVPEQALAGYNDIRPFGEGALGIVFCGSWGIGQLRNDFPEIADVTAVAPAPTKDGSPFKSTMGGWTYVIDAKTQKADAAGKYIYWLLGDDEARTASFFEVAKYSKYSPRKSVDDYIMNQTEAGKDTWLKTVTEQIVPNGIAEPIYQWDISAAMLEAIGDVLINGKSVEDSLAGAADKINTFIGNNNYSAQKP